MSHTGELYDKGYTTKPQDMFQNDNFKQLLNLTNSIKTNWLYIVNFFQYNL